MFLITLWAKGDQKRSGKNRVNKGGRISVNILNNRMAKSLNHAIIAGSYVLSFPYHIVKLPEKKTKVGQTLNQDVKTLIHVQSLYKESLVSFFREVQILGKPVSIN